MQAGKGRTFIGRFQFKADILLSIAEVCEKENIRLATFTVIGALNGVKLGYYNQDAKKYIDCVSLDKKLEITSCIGNVSLKDSKLFVHAHTTLADHEGRCFGGHLMPDSSIFAAEYSITELLGGELHRKPDPETGLSLW